MSEGQWPGWEGSFVSVSLHGDLDTQGRSLFSYLWGKAQGHAPSLTHVHTQRAKGGLWADFVISQVAKEGAWSPR